MLIRRNVLILHQGALGDFVLTLPLALAMGRMFPQSRIIYITSHDKGKLAERAVRVEAGDIEAGWHALFEDSCIPPESVAKLLNGAHTIFSFISEPGDVVSRNLSTLAPHANRFDMRTSKTPGTGHVSEWMVDDLKAIPAAAEAVRQMLRSIADRGLGTHRPIGRSVLLHPGSGADRKNWPVERYLELAAALKHGGNEVFTLLGEVEQEKWPADQVARFEKTTKILRPRTYIDLYEELIRTAAFVGNDSGPGHLAGIIGCAAVSIFGPTDPAVWRPLGPRTAVVRHDPIDHVEAADVLEALRSVGTVTHSGPSLRPVS